MASRSDVGLVFK